MASTLVVSVPLVISSGGSSQERPTLHRVGSSSSETNETSESLLKQFEEIFSKVCGTLVGRFMTVSFLCCVLLFCGLWMSLGMPFFLFHAAPAVQLCFLHSAIKPPSIYFWSLWFLFKYSLTEADGVTRVPFCGLSFANTLWTF